VRAFIAVAKLLATATLISSESAVVPALHRVNISDKLMASCLMATASE
jgi:hypothetical protein